MVVADLLWFFSLTIFVKNFLNYMNKTQITQISKQKIRRQWESGAN